MVAWSIVTVVLAIWNAIYCTPTVIADFRSPKPANGGVGALAS